MTNYAQHFSPLQTSQTEAASPLQQKNSAGGFSFQADKWTRLDRWLILGAEGGSYYATERALTRENAKTVLECLQEDGVRTVRTIVEVSEAGRAPKNDPAIFALALAASSDDARTRSLALDSLSRVCRTGTHLFTFVQYANSFRGWGRGLKKAVARWYSARPADDLAYQVLKYQQRNGWSHRDVLRLVHAEPKPEHAATYRWIVAGADGLGERTLPSFKERPARRFSAVEGLPRLLAAYEHLKAATSEAEVISLIHEYHFSHEMIPTQWKKSPAVWEALLVTGMPLGALTRNLGVMTSCGLLKPLSNAAKLVADRLTNAEQIKKARLHPIALLSALKTYQSGHGVKGSLCWSPERGVVDALDAGFYMAFDAIEPTGKRILLALDVSGSMTWGEIAGVPGLTPRVASAALAMVTARSEQRWLALGFSHTLVPLDISPRQRLDDVIRTIERVPMGGTDCSLPMRFATANQLKVDAFVVLTDSETWAGLSHPHQELARYRRASGLATSKLAVLGMVSNGFSIADPTDMNEMDFVGFDTSTPAVLADFIRHD